MEKLLECQFCNEKMKSFKVSGWKEGKKGWYDICNFCYKKHKHLYELNDYRENEKIEDLKLKE